MHLRRRWQRTRAVLSRQRRHRQEADRPGWYFHLPWNRYVIYDLRWKEHHEQIHLHTKDGLHLDLEVAVVVRPSADEIYDLDITVGPDFYVQVVRPALFAATRDGGGQFNHLDVATRTHEVEIAMKAAIDEHLKGQHVEIAADRDPALRSAARGRGRREPHRRVVAADRREEASTSSSRRRTPTSSRSNAAARSRRTGSSAAARGAGARVGAEQQLKIEEAKRKLGAREARGRGRVRSSARRRPRRRRPRSRPTPTACA